MQTSLDVLLWCKAYHMKLYIQSSDLIIFDKDLQQVALKTVQTVFVSKMNTLFKTDITVFLWLNEMVQEPDNSSSTRCPKLFWCFLKNNVHVLKSPWNQVWFYQLSILGHIIIIDLVLWDQLSMDCTKQRKPDILLSSILTSSFP